MWHDIQARYYVSLPTLKLVYYFSFQSHIQYSLLNWGRAAKINLRKLSILQNKILRAMLFFPTRLPTNLLCSKLNVLKINNMINMEFAKFMNKFRNQMLSEHFCDYFTKLNSVHQYNTKRKHRNKFYQLFYISTEQEKKNSSLNLFKYVEKYSPGISS